MNFLTYTKDNKSCSRGFTLVEIIVTILATGILGAIFINFMGTALTASWNAVEITRDEAVAEALMEQIIGEYVEDINSNPATALGNIVTNYNGQTINGVAITTQYITFDGSGDEVPSGSPEPNLKVVLQASGPGAPAITGRYSLTTVLTESRDTSDPIVIY
jgi:prepilin-type N-terminal cleavage/methylation domain-containing protein